MNIRDTNTSTQRERGTVLLASLLFAMTVLAFSGSIILSGVAVEKQGRGFAAAQRAQDAAESGVHRALALLSEPVGSTLRSTGQLSGVLQGTGDKALRYSVKIVNGGTDGVDNDLDGQVDEPDEADMLELTSTGTVDGVTRTVRVTLLARYNSPTMPGAVYIGDPSADVNFNGNAFTVSGYDVDPNGVATGLVSPGIGVAGDPSLIVNNINSNQNDNVIGSGGSPSVVEVAPIDMQALIDQGARAANVTLVSGGTSQPANPGDWGTLDSPAILYGQGDIHISGGGSGAGILIVDGNLKISGAFTWRGLIVVRGEVVFSGGGGNKMLYGGLVVEKDVRTDTTNSDGLTASGTVDVLLSRKTLLKVSRAFAVYTIVNWREGPNPVEAAP